MTEERQVHFVLEQQRLEDWAEMHRAVYTCNRINRQKQIMSAWMSLASRSGGVFSVDKSHRSRIHPRWSSKSGGAPAPAARG